MTRPKIRAAAAAALAAASSPAIAIPPPVEVDPVVVAQDPDVAAALEGLLTLMSRQGAFAASEAPSSPSPACIPGEAIVDCYAAAAVAADTPNLVFLVVEGSDDPLQIRCIGRDAARAQRAEFALALAAGEDRTAALPHRSALSGCLIGALHAPRAPRLEQ